MIKNFTLSLGLIFLTLSASAQGNWTQRANLGGSARVDAIGFSIGTKGYIGTGRNSVSAVEYVDFWEYNPSTNVWSQKADFGGGARHDAVGFSINNKGYIGTGVNVNGPVFFNDFWEYNPLTNFWSQKANFGGTGRYAACGFSIGNSGYIGTGYDGTWRKDFWKYNTITDTWNQMADYGGIARYEAASFSIGGSGYLGTGESVITPLNDFWKYDTISNAWTQVANFAGGARWSTISFSVLGNGYVGTGVNGSTSFNDIWNYSPSTDSWGQVSSLGGGDRWDGIGFSIGNKGYAGTGNSPLGNQNDFWEFSDTSNTQCSYLPSNLLNGLVGYWPFCGNANDESGNGYNGVINGVTLVADRFGNANKAYSFNGATQPGSDNTIVVVDNGIDIPNFSVNFSNTITISIWANVSNTNNGDFLDRRTDNNIDFVCSGGGNNINCHLGNIGTFAGNTNLSFNSWHHYVYVYNGSSIKLYVDGVLDSQSAASGFISNNTSTLRIGKYIYHGGLTHYFFYNGYLDDIGIWNRALTDPEIIQLYTGDTLPPCTSLPSNLNSGLVGYWPFCGNANDESGNGYDGIVNSATLTNDRFGNSNSAYNFNGTSDIILSNTGLVDFSQGITFSSWIKPSAIKMASIVDKMPACSGVNGFRTNIRNNGDVNSGNGCYGSGVAAVATSNYQIDNWYFIVGSYGLDDSLRIYVNGQLKSSLYTTTSIINSKNIEIGQGTLSPNYEQFEGVIDDVVIWNRALTPEEVVEIYSGLDTCTTLYYSDLDNDGYGGLLLGNFCSAPPNGVLQSGDCNDANSSIHPGVAEICNGVDDDCDGIADNGSVPVIGPILGNYQSCIPLATGNRTFSVVPVAGVNNYAWSLPVGMNLVSGQGTPTINVSWTSSTAHTGILGNLSVVPSMDCFTGNTVSVVADLNISVPVTPPSISGASRVCFGDVITYSISSVARARQYNWTLPTGMTLLSGQGSNVVSAIVDSSFTGGLLSVSGVNTCGASPLRSKTISYNIPNTPAVIVGQTQGICDLSSVIFTTAGSVGSLGYNWIVPAGITILNGQGSNSIEVSVSNNFTNGILRVVAINNCGISNQRTISLSGNPGIPSIISGPINICPGSTGNAYSVQTAPGATYYTWTVPASATITSGSSTKNITIDYSSATFSNQSITVRAGNLCGESAVRNQTGISGNISFCIRVSNGNDKSELSIYPNPANQILYLSANGDTPQNIEIYNLLGVRVKNQESGNEVILIDLVEGVYVLRAIINQKVVLRRFEVVR